MLVTYHQGSPFEHTESIRLSDPHRHKFDDALSEYVYNDMDRWADRSDGDADCPTGWWASVGEHRIIRGDSQGFVWMERFDDSYARDAISDALSLVYCEWSADEWDDDFDESTAVERVERAERYLSYVVACVVDQPLTAYDFAMWQSVGEPRGPLG